jgi:hypothetical protein
MTVLSLAGERRKKTQSNKKSVRVALLLTFKEAVALSVETLADRLSLLSAVPTKLSEERLSLLSAGAIEASQDRLSLLSAAAIEVSEERLSLLFAAAVIEVAGEDGLSLLFAVV